MTFDPCAACEELLQPFVDREITLEERTIAETHLSMCGYCRKRYRFEEHLRRYVRQACDEPMPVELKQRLAALRIPL